MAFNARFYFAGPEGTSEEHSMKVLEFDYGFTQPYDSSTNRVTGKAGINSLNLVLESSDDTQFADWMMHNENRDGRIEISFQNNNKRTVEFEKGICVNYHESYSHLGDESPMHLNVSFVVQKINIDGQHIHSVER